MTAPVFLGLPWESSALCAQTDPAMFFLGRGKPATPAKRICAQCEVRAECLATVLAMEAEHGRQPGVWGGTSERDRRRLRARAA